MNIPVLILSIFGIFNIIGGVMGFIKASSLPSLLAGCISGLLLLACAYGITQQMKAAIIGSLVISVLLLLRFGPMLLKNFQIMPTLLIVILAVLSILALIPQLKS